MRYLGEGVGDWGVLTDISAVECHIVIDRSIVIDAMGTPAIEPLTY